MRKGKAPPIVLRGTAKPTRPVGRPDMYSPDMANELCDRLANGESLIQICKLDHMPSTDTVLKWLIDKNKPDFVVQYNAAREMQAEYYSHEMADIADGTKNERHSHVAIESARLRIDSRKWLASKLRPKKYGDRIQQDVAVTITDLSTRLADARARRGK